MFRSITGQFDDYGAIMRVAWLSIFLSTDLRLKVTPGITLVLSSLLLRVGEFGWMAWSLTAPYS